MSAGRTRARSAPSACAWRTAARCTASPSTSPPTCATCASTSCRAGSPTSRSRRWPRRASTCRCARWSTSSPAGPRRRVGRRRRSSARTSPGSTGPTICRRSPAGRGRRVTRAVQPGAGRRCGVDRRPVRSSTRKPEWLRPKVVPRSGGAARSSSTVRDLDLVTVCEEAGCPNLSECWADGTATFMVLGERCTRACGFCLVDTRKPLRAGRRRAGAGRRGHRPDGPGPRRADDGGPRRPRRRRDGPRRRAASRRSASAVPAHGSRR